MSKKILVILCMLTLFSAVSCAWENLPEGEQEIKRIIQVTMRLGGTMRTDLFYYIVFNLSGDPNKKPYSVFDGEDRGKYWTVYYMYGQPPYEDLDLYRGFGGKGTDGSSRIDRFPTEQDELNELLLGTSIQGDQMTLRIDLTELKLKSPIMNMNMIVCNQAIDAQSKFEYKYIPCVWDSFYAQGVTIDLMGTDYYWNEQSDPMEQISNEHEDTASPEANIIGWYFQIVSR